MSKFLHTILFLILLVSCSENNKKGHQHNNGNIKKLRFESIDNSEHMLLKCYKLFYHNGYLIADDSYGGKTISIIDIKKRKIIKRTLNVGKGPNELVDLFYMNYCGSNGIQIGDINLKKMLVFSIDSMKYSSALKPLSAFSYKEFQIKNNEVLKTLYQLNDNLFIGLGIFNDSEMAIFTKNEENKFDVEYRYDYPSLKRNGQIEESNAVKYQLFQARIGVSPDKKHMVYFSKGCYYYKIFEILNNKLKLVYERMDDTPKYIVRNQNVVINDPKAMWGFLSIPVMTNKATYFLEPEKTYAEAGYYLSYTSKLLRIGWDGKIDQRYKLDHATQTITVDEKNRKIYALVFNPETLSNELGYYEF